MKRATFESSSERMILSAMVTHHGVLSRISQHINTPNPFRSKWSNIIAKWCLDHFQKFQKAPRNHIQSRLEEFAIKSDEKTVELIESFLTGLSGDYARAAKEINEEFIIDRASKYFRQVQLETIHTSMGDALESGDLERAEEEHRAYQPIQFASNDWTDPWNSDLIKRALKNREGESIIRFNGALDNFLSPHFERDGFISFAGPEKRGKSFWLLEVVYRALLERRKVLYYVTGDMSQIQVQRRILTRFCRIPRGKRNSFTKPTSIELKRNGRLKEASVQSIVVEKPKLTNALAQQGMERFKLLTGVKESKLKLKCVGSSALSASNIESDVQSLIRSGWVPDVVVIDYADVLAPEPNSKSWDYRHQINETWKVLRRISQTFHLLLVTATQTAATSYDSWLIKKSHFSEDKRKNAHVTGMLGINQTPSEKKIGVYRLNWIFLREGEWTEEQVCWTVGDLSIGCPCIISKVDSEFSR